MDKQTPKGYSVFRSIDVDETGNTPAAGGTLGRHKLYGGIVTSVKATVLYFKIYDKASAATASDTPVMTIAVPSLTTGAGFNLPIPDLGIEFSLGISVRCVTGVADNDNTGAGTNECQANLFYL